MIVEHIFTAEFMARAWTFGEVLLLGGIRWVWYALGGTGKKSFIYFIFSLALLCGFCVWLYSGAEPIVRGRMHGRGWPGETYHVLAWDFFCTLWAFLEGLVVLYVFRIYRLMKNTLEGSGDRKKEHIFEILLQVIIFTVLPLLYFFYHGYAFDVFVRYKLDIGALYNMLIFYRRIVGIFWIAFEGTIPVLIFLIYFLLRRNTKGETILG